MQARTSFRSLAVLAAAITSAAALAQVRYHVTEIQPLPGYMESFATSINDLGDVVGGCDNTDYWTSMPTIWRGSGAPAALGRVPRGTYAIATAINNSGVVAGEGDDGDGRPNVVAFKNGVASFIDSGANNSHAFAVLNNGQIVGNYLKGFGGTAAWNPSIWAEDKPGRYKHTFLPQYPDLTWSYVYANGANNLGVVVGQVSSTQFSGRGGLWKNDSKHTLTLLNPLPGDWNCYANAINDLGVVAGVSDMGTFAQTPVIWSGDAAHTVRALPLLPGENFGNVLGINNSGTVIGSHGSNPAVWVNGELVDIQSALDESGAGWKIVIANHINNKGQIVGDGLLNGKWRGFVLTPVGVQP